jgi:N-carbamoyl-L-amino-acid hydrolase
VGEAGVSLPVHLEAIDFTDEEGTLVGELGSGALAGVLPAEALRSPRAGREALEEGLARAGLTEAGILGARRDPSSLAGYLELHIEQGARLIEAGVDIGVVTGIVGIGSAWLTFTGRADHAGTTPMPARRDAAQGASAFTLATREIVDRFPDCTVNVGEMRFQPGAFNIVPARATLGLEYRAPDPAGMGRLEGALLARAEQEAARFGLGLEVERLSPVHPAAMSETMQGACGAAAESLGLAYRPLVSFAGHDGQALAAVCPAGMIFVPSVGGASHSAREFTRWEDCVNGANVLLGAALRFARGLGEQ